jgi:hypothetical protein
MSTLLTLKHPSMSMPAIWVWIVNSPNRLAQAVEYAGLNFTSYAIIQSKYILDKNERLYDQSACKQSTDVFLMFCVKKGDKEAERLRSKIRGEYSAPNIPYYVEAEKYQEMKYRLCASELHMEFYLDLFFDLCRPGERLLGVFMGLKCLVATKVCILHLPFNTDSGCSFVSYYPQVEDVYGSSASFFPLSCVASNLLPSNFGCRSSECITVVLWTFVMLTGMTRC